MSDLEQIPNVIIRASAGSGKTYALVRRLMHLLAMDAKPRSIVALTFTRKAAGEFFARLLQKLAEFAEEPQGAASYEPHLGTGEAARIKCIALLRTLLAEMNRMRMGTLDSFCAAMVQSLPFELGLTGAGALMSTAEERRARDSVLDAVLVDLMRPEFDSARRELVEAWKRASLGRESHQPTAEIAGWMQSLHEWYLECSSAERWGPDRLIWEDPQAAIRYAEDDLDEVRYQLQERLDVSLFKAKAAADRWQDFFYGLENHLPGTPLSDGVKFMLDPKRGDPSRLPLGGTWKIGNAKEVTLSAEVGDLLYRALRIVVGRELKAACTQTHGKRQLVALYERAYHRLVRGQGKLRFSDLALLLSGRLDGVGGAVRPDWQETWEMIRMDMEYRLDSKYDHWLFDEFQDTSRRQWRVFENLADEVLQDAEGRRTFFAVGDLKQSIYLWREAEPELFLGVEERYRHHRMNFDSLKVSWRSYPQVLQMVNDTFGNEQALRTVLPGAMQWWRFEQHEAAPKLKGKSGHAALIVTPDKETRLEAVVKLLREINPVARGLSCAVLVRRNDEARRLAIHLRALLQVEVICESEQAIATDNPVTLALLSVLQAAVHPGDGYAWQHLLMTPLCRWIEREKITVARLGVMVRKTLRLGGFLGVVKEWTERVRECCEQLDDFSEWRLRQFLEVAAEFDDSGSRDVDAFLQFARDYRVPGPGGAEALQVMTVHKSKGLEFDVVIMPDLQIKVLDDANRERLLWSRSEEGEVEWLLDRPIQEIIQWDQRLVSEVESLESRAAFEGLCRLYVAMTRAKRALYLVHYEGSKASNRSEAGLVQQILAPDPVDSWPLYPLSDEAVVMRCQYEQGSWDWYQQLLPQQPTGQAVPTLVPSFEISLGQLLGKVNTIITRKTPSGEEAHRVSGKDLLSQYRETGRQKGVMVHGLFAEIELVDGLEDLKGTWPQDTIWATHDGFLRCEELVHRALALPEIAGWFLREPGRVVWRERSFDVLLNGEWVSGQFDRVVLQRDEQGQWQSATILDFKTDEVGDKAGAVTRAEAYRPQLSLYVQAVSCLTGLPAERIDTALIFTALPSLHWVKMGMA